jgi:large subunit ribosomal protein L31
LAGLVPAIHVFADLQAHLEDVGAGRARARGWVGCSSGAVPLYTGRELRIGAMKDGIHPDYHEITVMMTDGTSYKTRSTYGKEGDTLRLEIDPKSHPAWTGGQHRLLDTGGQLARFNRRFQNFGPKQTQ